MKKDTRIPRRALVIGVVFGAIISVPSLVGKTVVCLALPGALATIPIGDFEIGIWELGWFGCVLFVAVNAGVYGLIAWGMGRVAMRKQADRESTPYEEPACPTCGYSLIGNVNGSCSACGADVTGLVAEDEYACERCGCNLTGNESGTCPQCGASPAIDDE